MSALLESNIERDEHMETCAVTSDVQLVQLVSTERQREGEKISKEMNIEGMKFCNGAVPICSY